MPEPDPAHELTYEQAIERLEHIIEQIESGEVGLEEAIQQYEAGTALIKRCRGILDTAEKRITELTADADADADADAEGPTDADADADADGSDDDEDAPF